jgi:hypothetical protein
MTAPPGADRQLPHRTVTKGHMSQATREPDHCSLTPPSRKPQKTRGFGELAEWLRSRLQIRDNFISFQTLGSKKFSEHMKNEA